VEIETKAIGMKQKWVAALETDYYFDGWTMALTDVPKA
jgi:hypothetical protein